MKVSQSDHRKTYGGDILSLDDPHILRIMEEDWSRSESAFRDNFDRMKIDWKTYWLIFDEEGYPTKSQTMSEQDETTRSHVVVPIARPLVDTCLSIMMSQLLPNEDDYLRTRAINHILPPAWVKIAKQAMLERLGYKQINIFDKMQAFILQGLTFYWTFGISTWRRTGGFRRRYTHRELHMSEEQTLSAIDLLVKSSVSEIVGEGMSEILANVTMPIEAKRDVYDPEAGYEYIHNMDSYPDFELIHTFNTRPDPYNHRDRRKWNFVMDKCRLSWADLYYNEWTKDNKVGVYTNLDELYRLHGDADTDDQTPEEEARTDLGDSVLNSAIRSATKGESDSESRHSILCHRYFTGNGFVVCDKDFKVVIRKQHTEGWVISGWGWSVDPTRFNSQSFMRLIGDGDTHINAIFNNHMDNQNVCINVPYGYDKNRIDPAYQGAPMEAGRGLPCNGPPKEILDFPTVYDVTQNFDRDVQFLLRNLEKVVGISENAAAAYTESNRTATEADIVNGATAQRMAQRVKDFEKMVFAPLLERIKWLDVEFMEHTMKLSIKADDGTGFVTITPQIWRLIAPLVEVIPTGTSWNAQEQRKVAGLQWVFNALVANPNTANYLDLVSVMPKIIKFIAGDDEPEDWMKDGIQTTIDPETEQSMFEVGLYTPPHARDDHQAHLAVHNQVETQNPLLQKHIQETEQIVANSAQSAAQMNQQKAMQPGQDLSQLTSGNQMSNAQNNQVAGVPPAMQGGM